MVNIYDFICSNSSYFNQLKFSNDDKIFIDYLCPITEKQAQAWSHKNCLMYVVHGSKGYASANQYHQSRDHQLLFIRKGGVILHQEFGQPYRALIFMFDDAAIRDFFAEFPDLQNPAMENKPAFADHPVIAQLPSSPFVESIFMSSLDYLKSPTAESRIALGIKFKELLVNLLREKTLNSFNRYLSQLVSDGSTAFIQLMRENSHYNFTAGELARIACMSLSTFKREFVKHFGVSPGKWLRDQRIARAKYLLANANKNISEVAFELGYSDATSFSKAFKLATGCYPTDFVKKQRSGLN